MEIYRPRLSYGPGKGPGNDLGWSVLSRDKWADCPQSAPPYCTAISREPQQIKLSELGSWIALRIRRLMMCEAKK